MSYSCQSFFVFLIWHKIRSNEFYFVKYNVKSESLSWLAAKSNWYILCCKFCQINPRIARNRFDLQICLIQIFFVIHGLEWRPSLSAIKRSKWYVLYIKFCQICIKDSWNHDLKSNYALAKKTCKILSSPCRIFMGSIKIFYYCGYDRDMS